VIVVDLGFRRPTPAHHHQLLLLLLLLLSAALMRASNSPKQHYTTSDLTASPLHQNGARVRTEDTGDVLL